MPLLLQQACEEALRVMSMPTKEKRLGTLAGNCHAQIV